MRYLLFVLQLSLNCIVEYVWGHLDLRSRLYPAIHSPLLGVWMAGCETAKKEMCEEICGGCR